MGNVISFERVEELLKRNGITAYKLSKETGVDNSTLSNWKRGLYSPKPDKLRPIADFFNVSVDYITFKSDDPSPANQEKATGKRSALRIPVLGRVPAGIPIEAIEDVLDFEELDAQVYSSDHEYFGLQIKGDSMYPRYLDGDIVIIRRQSTCDNGDDCVVYVNGYDATLKSVHFVSNGGIRLQPLNPEYSPRTYYPDDDPVSIAGVVVELRRKIKK